MLSVDFQIQQVEDTLNNSNDLFLTFRKEMEDMSKKTKALEKEHDLLKRKHENMNHNVLTMADERNQALNKVDEAKKREEKLRSIISQMQQQGRGISQGAPDGCYADDTREIEGEESDYDDYEGEDEDLSDEGAPFGHDDPSQAAAAMPPPQAAPRPFGPAPPPAVAPSVTANGH